MSPPCSLAESAADDLLLWTITNRAGETLTIRISDILHEHRADLGDDPGLIKDGVEAHLQELLAENLDPLGSGWTLIRREHPTAIGPVDLLCRDAAGGTVAVEVKRRAQIDGVEQLTRYLELLNRDRLLAPVRGVLAAQEFKLQARTLAQDRGMTCALLDYDEMRGLPQRRAGPLLTPGTRHPALTQRDIGLARSVSTRLRGKRRGECGIRRGACRSIMVRPLPLGRGHAAQAWEVQLRRPGLLALHQPPAR